jgi:chromosome transmission fidelity protein 1
VCPYYGARKLVADADVLVLPYSAVLSEETRDSLGISLAGNVVIFDEAHNLVDAVNSAHSCGVGMGQLTGARRQLQAYLERFSSRLSARNAQQVQLLVRVVDMLTRALTPPGKQGQQQEQGQGKQAQQQQGQGKQQPVQQQGQQQGQPPAQQQGQGKQGQQAQAPQQAQPQLSRLTTVNDFLFDCGLDGINMLPLLAWAKETKLLIKVTLRCAVLCRAVLRCAACPSLISRLTIK